MSNPRNIALVLALLFITAAHALENPCPLPPVEYDPPFKGILIFSEGHDQDCARYCLADRDRVSKRDTCSRQTGSDQWQTRRPASGKL
jgi:hypothetical protein